MAGDKKKVVWEPELKDLRTQAEKLDRALVTGLMLEVILEASRLPVDPKTLRHLVKTRLKDSLADNLAGRVTLDRFRHLLSQVDIWFPLYYPLTTAGASKAPAAPLFQAAPPPAAAASPSRKIFSSSSCWTLPTTSSMRPGWMRPSSISRSSDSRATSRRIGSKQDSSTAPGA